MPSRENTRERILRECRECGVRVRDMHTIWTAVPVRRTHYQVHTREGALRLVFDRMGRLRGASVGMSDIDGEDKLHAVLSFIRRGRFY